jgi:glyoxylase-like metal-dependent hydrolase (beta-lactamase superfamily II)
MWREVFDRNPYGTNCWLLAADGSQEALVVDPGFEPPAVRALLEAADKVPAGVLLTHAHVDHAGQAGEFAGEVPVYIHPADAPAFADPIAWGSASGSPLAPVRDLRPIADGDIHTIGGIRIEVRHTPGHTPGHCVFLTDADLVLSGDLVFAGTLGRSDFPNSSPSDMRRSLERFLTLPDDLEVLPGHGPGTTVGRERSTNPFLSGLG